MCGNEISPKMFFILDISSSAFPPEIQIKQYVKYAMEQLIFMMHVQFSRFSEKIPCGLKAEMICMLINNLLLYLYY